MSFSSKEAPDTPDLDTTVNAQTGGNIGLTNFNNAGTLYGTSSNLGWTEWNKEKNAAGETKKTTYIDPYTGEKYKTPSYVQELTLSPEEQQKYDLSSSAQIAGLQGYNDILGSLGLSTLDPYDYTKSIGDYGGSVYQPGAAIDPLQLGNEETEKRLYELGSARLDPQFAQEDAALDAKLTAQGLRPGTAAWDAAKNQQSYKENDAYNQLLLTGRAQSTDELQREWDSQLASRSLSAGEQAQQFGQAKDVWGQDLASRGQYSTEELAKQAMDLSTAGVLGTAGGVQSPQFTSSTPAASPYTDYAGLINTDWDQQFKAWEAEQQAKSSGKGGVMDLAGSLGSAAIMSDERIKDNIKQVGKTADGLPIYEFSIGDGAMQTGVMAQDVEKVDPSAVVQDPATGLKGVNYDQAVGDGTGTYTVEKGDNISKIGQRLGVDPQAIIEANPDIQNPDFIVPGQQLVVPGMAAPGPEAIPMPGGGQPAVAAALAGGVGPGMMPPGAMPPGRPDQAAIMQELMKTFPGRYQMDGGSFRRAAPPANLMPQSFQPRPDQVQVMQELARQFPERFQAGAQGDIGPEGALGATMAGGAPKYYDERPAEETLGGRLQSWATGDPYDPANYNTDALFGADTDLFNPQGVNRAGKGDQGAISPELLRAILMQLSQNGGMGGY